MTDKAAPEKKEDGARKKSQKRQRNWQIKIPCLEGEFNEAAEASRAAGLSKAAWGRAKMFGGNPGPRSRRRLPIQEQALVKALALHGRYGNNMNQIAHQLNAQGEDALSADFRRALKEWAEIRDAMYEALGRDPSGSTPTGHTPA
jgi:hypothetical protein